MEGTMFRFALLPTDEGFFVVNAAVEEVEEHVVTGINGTAVRDDLFA